MWTQRSGTDNVSFPKKLEIKERVPGFKESRGQGKKGKNSEWNPQTDKEV
jgi:hypothetical protein